MPALPHIHRTVAAVVSLADVGDCSLEVELIRQPPIKQRCSEVFQIIRIIQEHLLLGCRSVHSSQKTVSQQTQDYDLLLLMLFT